MLKGIIYKKGDKVIIGGLYVCVPCGYKQKFIAGDILPACMGCVRTSRPFSDAELEAAQEEGKEIDEFDEEAYAPNLELWELLQKE